MNVKVQCTCGQAFEFDVEPVNGAMPCAINCPTCNADATELANQAIMQSQSAPPPPPSAPPASGLRINRPAALPPTAPAVAAAPPPAEQPKRFGYTRTLETDKAPPPSQENVPMGILGGVIGAFVAMLIWYSITIATGFKIGFVAWGVGIVTGVCVQKMGRDGTQFLGFIAAVCAAVAILGGDYLVTSHYVNIYLKTLVSGVYEEHMIEARNSLKLKTDDQIHEWINKNSDDDTAFYPKTVEEFNSSGRAKMQDFVDGKPSREEYEKAVMRMNSTSDLKFRVFKDRISLFTLLWLFLGISTAYRIGSA